MIEIVTCEIVPGRGSRSTLYVLAIDKVGQLRVNALAGVNLNDEVETVVAIGKVGFGSDPVEEGAKLTHQFDITPIQLQQIIDRSSPEIAKAFLDHFSQILE